MSDKDLEAMEMLAPCSLEQRAHLVLPEIQGLIKTLQITAVPSLTTDFFASTYRPIQLPASPATQQRLVG